MEKYINLHSAALYTEKNLNHQKEAWDYLQSNLTSDILEKFANIYRSNNRKIYVNSKQLAYIWNIHESTISEELIFELNQCLELFKITTKKKNLSFFITNFT